jgi:hypothetical protein
MPSSGVPAAAGHRQGVHPAPGGPRGAASTPRAADHRLPQRPRRCSTPDPPRAKAPLNHPRRTPWPFNSRPVVVAGHGSSSSEWWPSRWFSSCCAVTVPGPFSAEAQAPPPLPAPSSAPRHERRCRLLRPTTSRPVPSPSRRSRPFTGRLVSAEDGRPVVGAEVTFLAPEGATPCARAPTGASAWCRRARARTSSRRCSPRGTSRSVPPGGRAPSVSSPPRPRARRSWCSRSTPRCG